MFRVEPEQGIPVEEQALNRSRNHARSITISDLDVAFPLNNLGVNISHIARLQNLFRTVPGLEYDPVRARVCTIVEQFSPRDLYILVDYVITLYQSVERSRPNTVTTTTDQNDGSDSNGNMKQSNGNMKQSNGNMKQSKKHRQRNKKRTLLQFG